mmetsp:Transcript_63071/g.110090  ORF Transcript_63071/g.110090 Transcript_63071/m.110090 type:complete len:465 (-) Transcript_63071:209-1603(-)
MAIMLQRFVVFLVGDLFLRWSYASEVKIRGVAPVNLTKYACQNDPCSFTCFSGEKDPMPYDVVNDDYCDCADGSDEPGTAACSDRHDGAALFYCRNEGAHPKLLYSSHVSDGICDCCDGSDENGLDDGVPPCKNTCDVESERHRAMLGKFKEGIERLKMVRREAKYARQKWKQEAEGFKVELPKLERELEEKKKAAQVDIVKLIEELQAKVKEQHEEIQRLYVQQDELRAENQKLKDEIANGTQTEEAGEEEVEAPKISEYAKWMDKSAGLPQAQDEPKKKRGLLGKGRSQDSPKGLDYNAQENATELVRILTHRLEYRTKEANELDEKIAFWTDDRIGYFSLQDKCLEEKAGEFWYKICFFKTAHQNNNLFVGSWHGWKGQTQARFSGGTACEHGGPEREMLVNFQCGPDEKIASVYEADRCVYEAVVTTPGACGQKTKQAVAQAAIGHIPEPRHPRDHHREL